MSSPDGTAASPAEVMQELILAAWVSQGITAAADLRVADALSAGPLPIDELAATVGADPDALGRLLRALIGQGIFARRDDGRYELTPMAELLRSDAPVSVRRWRASSARANTASIGAC
ncbi:methyltransferase family protein [Mycobacterium interjectum]|uniref:methyltransferase family protein n=1 Tax=Mycobacterium interjectum TaxID=33895 RepID=UPI0021F2A5B4|nr:methyltransferase dimerization domain-containing protein [Mycobacterium interjectum]